MKQLYSILTLLVFTVLFVASNSVKHLPAYNAETYVNISRPDKKDTTLQYELPEVSMLDNTKQEQKKGGVTIWCEIVPFEVNLNRNTENTVFYADPNKPDYDIFRKTFRPYYTVNPEHLCFKISIKNGMERLLKIKEVALAMTTDGQQYSLPDEFYKTEWREGDMIMQNAEKQIFLKGPQFETLKGTKVVNIVLADIPVAFDAAGNITKRENFEWSFAVKSRQVTKQENILYTYEEKPVYKEQCRSCVGVGRVNVTCASCNGTGKYKGYDGKIYACLGCNGTGKRAQTCSACAGLGQLAFPKSNKPALTSSVSWYGYRVSIQTMPEGANVKVINPRTNLYMETQSSNCSVDWYYTGANKKPIIIEFGGKEVKVLPYKNGKESAKIKVDFTGSSPVVKVGQEM